MKIERIAPILTVDDLPTAIAEHTSVLGMHVVMHMDWVAFLADGTGRQIGLVTADATASVNPDVSVFVDDVETAHAAALAARSEEHTSELQSRGHLVCRLLLEKKKNTKKTTTHTERTS